MGNFLGGGDKNSPKTSSASTSVTKTTQIGGAVTNSGAGSIGGAVTLSDLTGVTGPINISTTDQGAVSAGLQVALAGLDAANQEHQLAAATETNAVDTAGTVAQTAAQGQQNTSLKYIIYGVAAVAAAAVLYAYVSHK